MDVHEIAERIEVPLDKWPGNCFGIVMEICSAGLIPGEPRYGAYRGPVDEDCVVEGWYRQRYSGPGCVRPCL